MPGDETVGLVLAGGGARGAYEAGVLAVLLPELERRGQRPKLIVGTSVGAINAAFLAATAHLPAPEVADLARRRWLDLDWRRVLRPILGPSTLAVAGRYAGAVAGVPGVELKALLDPAPLAETLDEWIDWERLHRNAASDDLDAVAIVATAALRARSRVFVEGGESMPSDAQEVDYLSARLGTRHLLASAAIPGAFPAVRLEHPESAAGWYFDGGTRLNTPIKPAIDLGVDRLIVVATHSVSPAADTNWHLEGRQPDVAEGLVHLLFAALVDPLIADVRMLGKVNLLVDDGVSRAVREHSDRHGRRPPRRIPYMFIAPAERDRVGDIAAHTYAEHHSSPRRQLADRDLTLLTRLLGGVTEPHGELLSYLLFTPEFAAALIEQGERDARRWLERDWGEDGPWLTEPLESLEA